MILGDREKERVIEASENVKMKTDIATPVERNCTSSFLKEWNRKNTNVDKVGLGEEFIRKSAEDWGTCQQWWLTHSMQTRSHTS